jgi:uncharacterized protein
MQAEVGGALRFRTNFGEEVVAGARHPLRFEAGAAAGVCPYVLVRAGLWARLTRAVALELLQRAEERTQNARTVCGVTSGAHFFALPDLAYDDAGA